MKIAPLPADEQGRLDALRKYNILDTEPEAAFDAMVQLASYICKTPIAAISLVDENRQWFKAVTGLNTRETSRDVAFCAHTILHPEPMVVPDARLDERFFDNPLVTSSPDIRFYAGVPLVSSSGHHLGSLCVIDRVPRELGPEQLSALKTLADSIMAHLDLRLSHKQIRQYTNDLQLTATIFEASSDAMMVTDADNRIITVNPAFTATTGYTLTEVVGKNPHMLSSGHHDKDFYQKLWQTLNSTGQWNGEVWNKHKNGELYAEQLTINAIFNEDGSKRLHVAVFLDISKRKQLEEQLRQLTLEQHAMLDNELVGIVKLKNRRIVWKNKALDKIFGYEAGELNDRPTSALYPSEAAAQALGAVAYPILKAKGVYRTQLEMMRKNGEIIWVDLSGVELPGEEESLWMLADITLMMKHHEQVERMANHDVLTGLPNRLLLSDRLEQALAQAERQQRLLAVCYLDLDGFKPINDHFGHEAGDKLLKAVASRMQASVRTNDTVARLGGDEFVLLLTNLENVEEYQSVLERVIKAINQSVALDETHQASVTASIGITLFPFDSSDPDTLLRHADHAMYQAKSQGRNRVSLFEPDIAEHMT